MCTLQQMVILRESLLDFGAISPLVEHTTAKV